MSNCGEDRILGLCPMPQDFRRHISGVRWPAMKMASDNNCRQRPDAPSAHRRLGYPSSGCVPAEPDSVSPSNHTLASMHTICKNLSDTGVMPEKSICFLKQQRSRFKSDIKSLKSTHSLGRRPCFSMPSRLIWNKPGFLISIRAFSCSSVTGYPKISTEKAM